MKRYKWLQIEEREEIMKGVVYGKSFREIASKLRINVSKYRGIRKVEKAIKV